MAIFLFIIASKNFMIFPLTTKNITWFNINNCIILINVLYRKMLKYLVKNEKILGMFTIRTKVLPSLNERCYTLINKFGIHKIERFHSIDTGLGFAYQSV